MDISSCGEVILVMPANNPDILLVTADNILQLYTDILFYILPLNYLD